MTVYAGAALFTDRVTHHRPSWLGAWNHWDVSLYAKVARFGYDGYPKHYSDRGIAAFFPGLPLLLRVVHSVVPSWIAAGLLISLVAGGVAIVALARLAELEGAFGERAVLALVVSPYAVFLAAGYSEALFLAFALPAWLAARRRAWLTAGLLATAASTVRVTGLFLALALIVEYAVTERRWRSSAAALLAPVVPVGIFVVYLHSITDDWLAWPHAESSVWQRHLTAPWTALHSTWLAATVPGQQADFAWQFGADIGCIALGVALTGWLLWRRRFGEATYVGSQVAALATSSYYLSVGRATLLWWPLWVGLARIAGRRPALFAGYVALAAPLMIVSTVGFGTARWVG
jgi:mannosyltransferase PIG-V